MLARGTLLPFFGLLLAHGAVRGSAQTLSDCHSHGNVEYCVGPDGQDVAITTHAPSPTQGTTAPASTTTSGEISEVTGCHGHGSDIFCIAPDGSEVQVSVTATLDAAPAEYTGCHGHGSDTYCFDPEGNEVQLVMEESHGEEGHDHEEEGDHGEEGENCHFHAGVEHCTKPGEPESGFSQESCERRDREYNIPLRIGTLFVILVTSAIAVYGPVVFVRIFSKAINVHIFTVIKQFGTGIMLATAFIHLFTHAHLMFSNPCLGGLAYEGTTAAIAMAGIFLTFLLEYMGNRLIIYKRARDHCHHHPGEESDSHSGSGGKGVTELPSPAPPPHQPNLASLGHHHHHVEDKLSVLVMEAGIIFHSVIIGLTLVVAGDSGYISLFIVIIFHQAFEGLALGSRIAELTETSMRTKLLMSTAFALITPIGMAIGIGVIDQFNGNAKGTIAAIGTLDALSAGILAWAALVDMLSHDWLYGDLKCASPMRTFVGMSSLVTGMILMGLLGKWA